MAKLDVDPQIKSVELEMVVTDYDVDRTPLNRSIRLQLVTRPGGLYKDVPQDDIYALIKQVVEYGRPVKVTIVPL